MEQAEEPIVRQYLRRKFSETVALSESEIFDADLSLTAIMSRASGLTNSVDLMEAFAKTAKGVRLEFGVRVRLPALPLDTPISEVIDLLVVQVVSPATGDEPTQPTPGADHVG